MRYILYPPFLVVPEETDFSATWESFCLKLLKLELKTNDIEKRNPPESGVDLYFPNKKLAFQCKSIYDRSHRFNKKKIKDSIDSALTIKQFLPWDQYIVCCNENMTGDFTTKLKENYPDIDIKMRGKDYWIHLCEQFSKQVERNFRTLLPLSKRQIVSHSNFLFSNSYSSLKDKFESKLVKILLYSYEHDKVYEINVPENFKLKELNRFLMDLFNLKKVYSENHGNFNIVQSIIFDDVEYTINSENENTTLDLLGVTDNSVMLYKLKILIPDLDLESDKLMFNDKNKYENQRGKSIIKGIFQDFDKTIGSFTDEG
ncbi:hypothetical protein PAEAM_28620 [Paenibacillus sp. GM1FR]|uniref:hypothetical protein n=1 Tax=Paenibacillus sp. GM1FR TaxID=2059267 RepID=UPI000C26F0D2|nr:hypothetical protein [Paenibacillus sp. GM1FR]PJN59827.1 hypothetical protein PAEAM_28620 [Paenibacillus sp. GM1FR]